MKIIGFDAVPEARAAIKAGKIYADVIQQPNEIGRKTIEAITAYIAGGQVATDDPDSLRAVHAEGCCAITKSNGDTMTATESATRPLCCR